MHLWSPGWQPALQAACPTLRLGWVARWPPATPAISFFHLKLQGSRLAVSFSTPTQVSMMFSCLVPPFSVSDVIWGISKFLIAGVISLGTLYEAGNTYRNYTWPVVFPNLEARLDWLSEAIVAQLVVENTLEWFQPRYSSCEVLALLGCESCEIPLASEKTDALPARMCWDTAQPKRCHSLRDSVWQQNFKRLKGWLALQS